MVERQTLSLVVAGESLRNARRFGALEVNAHRASPSVSTDLSLAFPYVPDLLLAVLMSAYSTMALRAVLSTERVRALKIWTEFSEELQAFAAVQNPDLEQSLCDEYLRRFANICASMQGVAVMTEAAREAELGGQGKTFGKADGDGNCLISSIFQGMRRAGLLPQPLVENPRTLPAEVLSCRAALVELPFGHRLRPVERDVVTNRVSTVATDEEHANAYLQFDVHALWIVQYFLTRHAMSIPAGGVVVKCYSRFDAVLGAVESVALTDGFAAGNVAPCDIGVYNFTGQAYCGFHYVPLHDAGEVPPPPAPSALPGHERPPKKAKGDGNKPAAATSQASAAERPAKKQKGDGNSPAAVPPQATPAGTEGPGQSKPHEASPQHKADISAVFYRISALPSGDPSHGDLRDLLQQALELVGENLREHPTLPSDPLDAEVADAQALLEDAAVELPVTHCAFAGCTRRCGSSEELSKHLASDDGHSKCLAAVTRSMPPSADSMDVRRFSAYCEAIAWKVRQGAPLDTYAIDRRAVLQYNRASGDDQIYMPICFSCARRFPYIASLDKEGPVVLRSWKPL